MTLVLEKIETARGIRDFAEAPFGIREKRFLAGVSSTEWTTLLLGFDFPFERAHWLARDGAKIVGRIGANVSAGDSKRGMIGFYECMLDHPKSDEIHRLLVTTAEEWLRARRVKTAYGPVDYQTWFPYRFRTSAPEGTPDFEWEPLQPDVYPELWRTSGFEVAERYTSRATRDISETRELMAPQYAKCVAAGFSTRPFRKGSDFSGELGYVQEINRRSFQSGFLTEAIDPAAYVKLYAPQFAAIDTKYCYFALDPSGKEIGYFFVFGDQGQFIWKTIAVASEYQRLGVGAFGIHHGLGMALRDGFQITVPALVKEDAPSTGLIAKIKKYVWSHEYAVFKKDL